MIKHCLSAVSIAGAGARGRGVPNLVMALLIAGAAQSYAQNLPAHEQRDTAAQPEACSGTAPACNPRPAVRPAMPARASTTSCTRTMCRPATAKGQPGRFQPARAGTARRMHNPAGKRGACRIAPPGTAAANQRVLRRPAHCSSQRDRVPGKSNTGPWCPISLFPR